MSEIQFVVKRNGSVVPFTPERISNAIYRAAVAVGRVAGRSAIPVAGHGARRR